jgi:hypothetical protein
MARMHGGDPVIGLERRRGLGRRQRFKVLELNDRFLQLTQRSAAKVRRQSGGEFLQDLNDRFLQRQMSLVFGQYSI